MPDWLLDLFARYGYAVVFVGVFLENAGVPVPGETALVAGGVLAHFGRLSLVWVIAVAIAGAILGDNLGFFIGRRGGRKLAERVQELPKDRTLLVYCAGGYRSSIAASVLQERGFARVQEIAGGLAAWEAANLPVHTASG